jgi:tetratricopeptide (TPR) repeat protein
MRVFACCLLALLIGATIVVAQDERTAILQDAQARYAAGDWSGASVAFERLLTLDSADPAIYINLGHAYARQGRVGEALLNYRRAERLTPRDPDVLRYIAGIIAGRHDPSIPADTPLAQLYRLTADLFTLQEFTGLTLFVWTGLFALWAVAQVTNLVERLRSSLRLAALGLTILLIPMLVLLAVRLYVETWQPQAVLVAEQAEVRSGPAARYMDLYTVYAAAEMRVLDQREGWVLVELDAGRLGWLPVDSLRLVRTIE